MSPGILISLIVTVVVLVGAYGGYQRFLKRLAPDEDVRQVNGARLTSERLRQLSSPPWRVVFEIGEDKLGGVDHVVIGPSGVIAVSTVMADRPAPGMGAESHNVAAAAILRSGVDDLAKTVGLRCDNLAKVFWGTPQPHEPASFELLHATTAVEGQRVVDWLFSLPPGPLTAAQVDMAWQAIVVGIGRPDPLP